MENFIFPLVVVDEHSQTLLCGLLHVLRLGRVDGIRDVGFQMYEALRTPEDLRAMRSFQRTYWSQLLF